MDIREYTWRTVPYKSLCIVLACYYGPGAHPADATEGGNRALLAPSPWPGSSHHPMSYNCGPCRMENRVRSRKVRVLQSSLYQDITGEKRSPLVSAYHLSPRYSRPEIPY